MISFVFRLQFHRVKQIVATEYCADDDVLYLIDAQSRIYVLHHDVTHSTGNTRRKREIAGPSVRTDHE